MRRNLPVNRTIDRTLTHGARVSSHVFALSAPKLPSSLSALHGMSQITWEWLIQGLHDFTHICGWPSTGTSEDSTLKTQRLLLWELQWRQLVNFLHKKNHVFLFSSVSYSSDICDIFFCIILTKKYLRVLRLYDARQLDREAQCLCCLPGTRGLWDPKWRCHLSLCKLAPSPHPKGQVKLWSHNWS